jgi:hypothetical protein
MSKTYNLRTLKDILNETNNNVTNTNVINANVTTTDLNLDIQQLFNKYQD